ncbi:MAG: CoA pyrophosphatase [Natronospirillum sp.]|uniref:NUDIX hydrolase n=1 Tax=Natronospirillum sp. TaxID=2812955 RepID=UPI0025E3FD6C|nr:CoA pyrophosphatase [Natronospirillum sp.]MCH8553180.1 CoA pyrophosphatase [Natronospirillum sp.]
MTATVSTDWLGRLHNYQPRLVPDSARQAAVMVLLADSTDGLQMLLTQRSRHLVSHPGEVSFPGGNVEPYDDDLYCTALRETREETGLTETPNYVGQLDSLYAKSGIQVSAFVSHLDHLPHLVASPDEVAEVFWVPLAELLHNPPRYEMFERQGRQWRVPFFDYEQWTIWGMTGMILVNCLNVIQGSDWPGFHEEWSANPMDAD